MPEYIEIVINGEGEVKSEVHGVMGPECEALTDWLEELGEVVESHRTPDYHRQQGRRRSLRIGL